jgi:plastocyanin
MRRVIRNEWLHIGLILAVAPLLCAQKAAVTAHLDVVRNTPQAKAAEQSSVVVWLTPVGSTAPFTGTSQHLALTQKNKSFEPHLLVVPVGAVVDFPNRDPFFHNVFSLFEGKRFDLGLYEAGTSRRVHFDRVGVSYIFCNIHPEMSAVVVVLDTPYYGIANSKGTVAIPDVPTGRYILHVWDERSLPEVLTKLTREVVVAEDQASLGTLTIAETELAAEHKNKYGHEYDRTAPSSPVYVQP